MSDGTYDEPISTHVYLSTSPRRKQASVGALFAQDLGPLLEARVVNHHRYAFTAREVLSFMKAVAAHVANGAQELALVFGKDTLCRVLDDQQIMTPGDRHNLVHLAANTGIVDWERWPRVPSVIAASIRRSSMFRVSETDIHEYRSGAAQHDWRAGGRDEGKRWKNHLIAWTGKSHSSAAISSAAVQELVASRIRRAPSALSINFCTRRVNGPSPLA